MAIGLDNRHRRSRASRYYYPHFLFC